MLLKLLLAGLLLVISCGKQDKQRQMCATLGEDCHPNQSPTPTPIPGPQGPKGDKGDKGDQGFPGDTGKDGDTGLGGTNCTIESVVGGANITCGNSVVFISNGINGSNGTNGTSCSVVELAQSHDNPTGGAAITCGLSTVIVINGASGEDGAAAYAVVGSVDACGPSGGYDEIFLRLASGALVALFTASSDATTARLTYLMDDVSYTTTDSQHCHFNIHTDIAGLRTISTTSPTITSESWQTY